MNITINDFLKDFNKIQGGFKPIKEKIQESDYIARLVICYEENTKKENENTYNKLVDFSNKLNKFNFVENRKENKYFYLLNKKDFQNESDFQQLKEYFLNGNNNKILTINLKNFELPKIQKFLDFVINILESKNK